MRGRRRELPVVAGAALTLALALGSTPGIAQAATPGDAWSGGLADSGNSSVNAGEHVLTAAIAGRAAQAWTSDADQTSTSTDPAVESRGVTYWIGGASRLIAGSARTGATLWTKTLPAGKSYTAGATVVGGRLAVAYSGSSKPGGGVLVVDLARRKVVWNRALPKDPSDPTGDTRAQRPYTDGSRLFVAGSQNDVNAYRLRDGKPLWHLRQQRNPGGTIRRVDGIAVGSGVVITGGEGGLQAHRASDGRPVWHSTAATTGLPVLAAGRVFAGDGTGTAAMAFTAAGCGHTTCAPEWSTPSRYSRTTGPVVVSTADATSVYLTWQSSDGPAGACGGTRVGHIDRLDAATGATEWSTTSGLFIGRPLRGGDAIWVYDEYVAAGGCEVAARILAYPATGPSTGPVAQIDPAGRQGFQQGLSVGGGTLLLQDRVEPLIGYRVPGT